MPDRLPPPRAPELSEAQTVPPEDTSHGRAITTIGDDLPPTPHVPGYEILGALGQGGMGIVYEARDLRLPRRVALKMLAGPVLGDGQALARFRAEAENIARLQHPHIVQIYEVGEAAGQPYLALELVEGGSLAGRLRETTLAPRAAAELVETLARTMESAHCQGIVHRDLKPGNVLLTPDGTPKITDFGLAKRADGPDLTHTRAILGTPNYMPPEQAEGRPDLGPAADVYALGAILYESLTGRPPFTAPTPLEVLDLVRTQDPVRPRTLQPTVPRDLETICLYCLQKEPERRYASAASLAGDLQRYLEGRPILARPVPLWERGVKWARRKPATAGLAAAMALGTVLAFAGVFKYNADLAAEVRGKQAAREQTIAAAEALTDQVAAVVRPIAGTDSPRVERILRSAADMYDRLLAEEATPRAAAGKARLLNALADIYLEMNDSGRALTAADEALALHQRLVEQQPRHLVFQAGLAESHERRGDVLRARRTLAEALQAYRQAEEIGRRLAAERPREPLYRYELARVLSRMGGVYGLQGDLTQASAAFDEAFKLAEAIGARNDAPPERRRLLGFCYEKRGDVLYEYADTYDRLEEVLDQYRAALAIYEELAKREPSNTNWRLDMVRVTTSMGETLSWQNRPADARAAMERSLRIAESEAEHNPTHKLWRQELLRVRRTMSTLEEKDLRRRLALYEELATLLRERADQDPASAEWPGRLAVTLGKQADVRLKLAEAGEEAERQTALKLAEEALALARPLIRRDPDQRPWRMSAVLAHHAAAAAVAPQRREEAVQHLQAALKHLAWLEERNRLAPYEQAYIQQFTEQWQALK